MKEYLKTFGNRSLVQQYAVESLNLQYRIEQNLKTITDPNSTQVDCEKAQKKLNEQQAKNNAFEDEIVRRMK